MGNFIKKLIGWFFIYLIIKSIFFSDDKNKNENNNTNNTEQLQENNIVNETKEIKQVKKLSKEEISLEKIKKEFYFALKEKSLVKLFNKLQNINIKIKKDHINNRAFLRESNRKYREIENKYEKYKKLKWKIENIQISNIDLFTNFFSKAQEFRKYREYSILIKLLKSKFIKFIDKNLKNINDISQLKILLDLAQKLSLSEADIEMIKSKIKQLKIKQEALVFLKNLKKQNTIEDLFSYFYNEYKNDYGTSIKDEALRYIYSKINLEVKRLLNNIPDKIYDENDLNTYKELLKQIKAYVKKYSMDKYIMEDYLKKKNLYNKYFSAISEGIVVDSLTFIAPINNKLNITEDDRDLEIYIDGDLKYSWKKNAKFFSNKKIVSMEFDTKNIYLPTVYQIEIREKDLMVDDIVKSDFKLTKNDIILLLNYGLVTLNLKNTDYKIMLKKKVEW